MADYRYLLTVKEVVQNSTGVFTEAKIRWWIFHSDKNGFAPVIIRVGTSVFIDTRQLNRWLDNQRAQPVPAY